MPSSGATSAITSCRAYPTEESCPLSPLIAWVLFGFERRVSGASAPLGFWPVGLVLFAPYTRARASRGHVDAIPARLVDRQSSTE